MVILCNTKQKNNYQTCLNLCNVTDCIIYFNKPTVNINKHVITYRYDQLKTLFKDRIPSRKNIYLADYDKYIFESKEDLFTFIDIFLDLSKYNRLIGYSDLYRYGILHNKLYLNNKIWTELLHNLSTDADFTMFYKYVRNLEESLIHLETTSFTTYVFYEVVYKNSGIISLR